MRSPCKQDMLGLISEFRVHYCPQCQNISHSMLPLGGLRMPKFVFYWVRLKMWWKLSQMAILMGKTMINQWTFGGFSPKMSDVQLVMGALADEAGNTQGQKAKGTKAAWDFDGLRRMGHVFSWSVCGQPLGLFFWPLLVPIVFVSHVLWGSINLSFLLVGHETIRNASLWWRKHVWTYIDDLFQYE